MGRPRGGRWQCIRTLLAVVTLVACLPALAQAQVQSGSYTGDGTDNRAITVVGFQPDVVMANWNTAQTVTVTGVEDSLDDGNIACTITTGAATSSEGNYNGVNPSDVSVTTTDDDVSSFTVSPTSGLTTTRPGGGMPRSLAARAPEIGWKG